MPGQAKGERTGLELETCQERNSARSSDGQSRTMTLTARPKVRSSRSAKSRTSPRPYGCGRHRKCVAPRVDWAIATRGVDSYDVAEVTVRYSYLTPPSS